MTVACLTAAQAAISVGPSGSGTINFDTAAPTVADGWSTLTVGTSGNTYTTAAGLDTAASGNAATAVTTPLGSSTTVNPPSQNAIARWNSVNRYIQTRPTGNDYLLLLATLSNDSGNPISVVTIQYDYGIEVAAGQPIVEEIPGYRVFWSLTGAANSWTRIDDFSGITAAGPLSSVINLGTWAAGSPLYILWADDNGSGGNTVPGNQEGVYTIDNFALTVGGAVTENIAITSPTNTSVVAEGSLITINASVTMDGTISGVSFYHEGVLIGTDATSPYSAVYSNATLGAHTLTAVGNDGTHSITSAVVNITVNPNNPPTVTITNPGTQSYLVGANVINNAVAADSDGTIARVEFYLDGVLRYTDTTSSYNYQSDDTLAGTHTVLAVAVDNAGARGSNSVTFTITNPPNVTILLANGGNWKYLDDTNDPSLSGPWTTIGFNDSGWSNGVAEIGFGDSADDRPESTMVRRVVGPYTNITFYFRKVINVVDPTAYSGVILNVKQDDGSVVYINGVEVYRSTNMPAGPVTHGTFALSTQPDDGAAYYSSNLLSSVLVPGPNIIAVEMHQNSYTSSDISFDVMLWGTVSAGPRLLVRYVSSTQVEVSWPVSADTAGALLYFKPDLNASSWTLETGGIDSISGGVHYKTITSTSPVMKFWTLRTNP